MNPEYIGVISQYLMLVFIVSQVIIGVVISITTAIVSARLTNKYIQKELKQNNDDHKEMRADLKKIQDASKSAVDSEQCLEIRKDIHKTFCGKIEEVKTYMKDMDRKREQARIQMDRLIGRLVGVEGK